MGSLRFSLLAASALVASNAAHAQVVTIPLDVLTDLDARVTLNGARIDTLAGQVGANADATVALDARQQATAAVVAAHDTAIATLQNAATTIAARTTALETQVATTTAAATTVDAKIDVLDGKLATVDAKATANAADVIDLDARVLAATDATVTIDGRVTAVQTQVGALATGAVDTNGRLDALADRAGQTATAVAALVPQVAQNTRDITAVVPQVARNTRDIATLAPQVAQNARDIADVDARATAGIDGLSARVTLNDRRDDAQDATLNDHDRRIRVAQGTADTARTETATLRSDVDAGRAGIVRQVDPAGPVTVAAASGGTSVAFTGTDGDRRLTGVAAGIAGNDAATVGQVTASAADTLAAANGYTDRSIASALASNDSRFERMLAGNTRMLRADIDSSAAGSAALASLPQSIIPGSGMFGASIGGKGQQVAMALGLSKAFAAPHVPVIRAGAAIDTRTGDAVYNAAVGIHF